ncbi:Uncharacterised protein [Mycobacteroides abscessus subsp. abscessus]|nr:Uncharacterised protein [Mycobacteroides abscessus subsp. abscessus]
MSRMTCTMPWLAATSAIRSASSWASARNSASLSRKWWKMAPRESPIASSSLRTVAPS